MAKTQCSQRGAGTHASKFVCAIYCMHEVTVFSLFIL